MKILPALSNLSFRDGFWFLLGAFIGCEVVTIVGHLAQHVANQVAGE